MRNTCILTPLEDEDDEDEDEEVKQNYQSIRQTLEDMRKLQQKEE